MSQENVEIVERLVEAWDRGDLNAWLELFDEHVVWVPVTDHPEPEPLHGREGVLTFAEHWMEPWDYYGFHTIDLSDHGDVVIWTARHQGRQTGGVEMDTAMTAVFAFGLGRVVQVRWFWHREQALEAVGVRE
jgi:ketosteroid isomerase-like protein